MSFKILGCSTFFLVNLSLQTCRAFLDSASANNQNEVYHSVALHDAMEEIAHLKSVILLLKDTMADMKKEITEIKSASHVLQTNNIKLKQEFDRLNNKSVSSQKLFSKFENDIGELRSGLNNSVEQQRIIERLEMKLTNDIHEAQEATVMLQNVTNLWVYENKQDIREMNETIYRLTMLQPENSTEVPQSLGPLDHYRRTAIIFNVNTTSGHYLFIRGGISEHQRTGCKNVLPAKSNCSIPIRNRNDGHGNQVESFKAWRKGDMFLDWHGAEMTQETFFGDPARGTPSVLMRTPLGQGYQQWLVDVDMDCSKTENGWFEVIADFYNGNTHMDVLEGEIRQGEFTCNHIERVPYDSRNHWAKCGFINEFQYNKDECAITPFL